MEANEARFLAALDAAAVQPNTNDIGTLSEKTLHAVLKYYYEPDSAKHEVKIGRYVADIAGESGIFEIQTRSFSALRGKLDAFLPQSEVTVVYPIAVLKWICWVDPADGTVCQKRKSPKKGCIYDALAELYKIKAFLRHPRLHVRLVLLELTDYRLLDGYGADRKKGATRGDRIPEKMIDEVCIDTPDDYIRFLPEGLPAVFTSKDFAACAAIRKPLAQIALNVLKEVGAVCVCGKQGRALLYCQA